MAQKGQRCESWEKLEFVLVLRDKAEFELGRFKMSGLLHRRWEQLEHQRIDSTGCRVIEYTICQPQS